VLECLEKDPARRPPDALTVAQRLSGCAGARLVDDAGGAVVAGPSAGALGPGRAGRRRADSVVTVALTLPRV
jgi:hypothetical protein